MKTKRSSLTKKITAGSALVLLLVSSVNALCHNEVREPVVKFIDFYIASQEPVPELTVWERIAYGLAIAKAPEKSTPVVEEGE